MILSFKDPVTERFFRSGSCSKARWQKAAKVVARKLDLLQAAKVLDDLASPPGNRLEALRGDRKGQHSVRVNDQWRLCFIWSEVGPTEVEVVDYH